MTTMLGISDRQDFDQSAMPQVLTIAKARDIVAGWDLASGRKQKLLTALSTAARLLAPSLPRDVAYTQVSFDCSSLRRLRQRPAATFGLTTGRRTSLISELVFTLRQFGLHEPDTRKLMLPSDLQELYDAVPTGRQLSLINFFRFLEKSGVSPEMVNTDALVAYGAQKREQTLCSDVDRRMKQVATAWNWALGHVQGWPGAHLNVTPKTDRGKLSLPLTAFPRSFQDDVRQYTARLSGTDTNAIFADNVFSEETSNGDHRLRLLRPTSIANRIRNIRCAATALTLTGSSIESIHSLRDLVDPPARARSILKFYLDRNQGQTHPSLQKLADSVRVIARDYCCLPTEKLQQITTWSHRMRMPKQKGMTEKNRRRLRDLTTPKVRAMLLHMPAHLMKEASTTSNVTAAARLAMYATALELLLICPMRRGNLAGLQIDRHLHRPDPRKPMVTHIFISGDEVKNEQELQWPVPIETAKLLNTYLTKHRHHLTGPGNPFLFPSTGDRGRSAQQIATWLSDAVRRYIGVEFNAHLIRHFSAWNYLQQNPGQYETVRRVLGHGEISTTIQFYVGLEVEAAAKHFDAVVLRNRVATRKIAHQAFRAGRGGLSSRKPEERT